MCCFPGTRFPVNAPVTTGFNVPFTFTAASKASPTSLATMIEGIVIVGSSPPIATGVPDTLFIMTTPIAPASCAFFTFSTNVPEPGAAAGEPRLINAIFPLIAAAFVNAFTPKVGSLEPSFTNTIFAVIGVETGVPKAVVG